MKYFLAALFVICFDAAAQAGYPQDPYCMGCGKTIYFEVVSDGETQPSEEPIIGNGCTFADNGDDDIFANGSCYPADSCDLAENGTVQTSICAQTSCDLAWEAISGGIDNGREEELEDENLAWRLDDMWNWG